MKVTLCKTRCKTGTENSLHKTLSGDNDNGNSDLDTILIDLGGFKGRPLEDLERVLLDPGGSFG